MKKTKKSQSVVIDFFIAIFIFVIIVSITTLMWNRLSLELHDKVVQKDMLLKAYHITDTLIESPGSPSNWESEIEDLEGIDDRIKSIGLADSDRQLSLNKIYAFLTLVDANNQDNYNMAKKILNIEGFDFYVKLYGVSFSFFEEGKSPNFYVADRTITIRRYITINDEGFDGCQNGCIFEFSLWE